MLLTGAEWLESLARQTGFSAKLVFNDAGAIFFPANLQHRDQKAANISYQDDYAGNALAAMIAPGRIEIRYHRDFTDQHVTQIVQNMLAEPSLAFMQSWQVTYQGRTLSPH